MYLVDVSPSMHEAAEVEEDQPDGTTTTRYISNLSTSLKSCLDLMKSRIISGNSRDVIGFLLYNTVNTKYIEGELPKNGLYLLMEPQTIRAHNIKMLSDLVEEAETDPKAFKKRFQPIDTDVRPSHILDGMKMAESLLRYRYVSTRHGNSDYECSNELHNFLQIIQPIQSLPLPHHGQRRSTARQQAATIRSLGVCKRRT